MNFNTRFGILFSVAALATFLGACSDESSPNSADEEQSLSSSVEEVPSSSSVDEISSSSSAGSSSSGNSVTAGDSSSSSSGDTELRVPEGGKFHWDGANDGSRVMTGLDNGTGTSGYWYWYNDKADGGNSRIDWPVEEAEEGDMLKPVIEACQGICGTFILDEGTLDYEPFVVVGFNIAGTETFTGGSAVPADISAWGGLCVTYSSTNDIELDMSFGDAGDAGVGYFLPCAFLHKSTEKTEACIPWKRFSSSSGWLGDIEKEVKHIASIKFRIQGESGTEGEFNIMSVGSYVEQ
ncbi:MAG: hypothetical protein IKX42_05335 [Fibrobacter sp.]|nr:hypothetical protein [Fibrobacter sp.]